MFREADAVPECGRQQVPVRYRECRCPPARSKNQGMSESSRAEHGRSTSHPTQVQSGRDGKAHGRNPSMYGSWKSDRLVVPEKSPNEPQCSEEMEGRGLAKGNAHQLTTYRTQCRASVPCGLERVRQAARRDRKAKFNALLHHVTPQLLADCYCRMNRRAAAGIDGITWAEYGQKLEGNLQSLLERVHRGAYRARPSRRVWIPKADGTQRPLGIATLEEKLLQVAVAEVLQSIYEEDFLGFSYGFRPGRSPHHALDALYAGILTRKVNWVLDADVRDFFGTIDHEWVAKMLEHRIADQRILRLVRKWLSAGVLEAGRVEPAERGTAQGAAISPLLANVFLHYVLDTWAHRWRRTEAGGDVVIVRYCDDFIVGVERRSEAQAFLAALQERLAKFRLELHPEKTRLVRFGRYANERARWFKERRAGTFRFLGFVHACGRTQSGKYLIVRHTEGKRVRARLQAVKAVLMRRRHRPIPEQGAWLGQVLRGYFAYHAVPTNLHTLLGMRAEVTRQWRRALNRRSQRGRVTWARMKVLEERWLPRVRILHPYPLDRFHAMTRGGSPVR